MAKRTNRVAWRFVAVLSLAVLIGVGVLVKHYQRQLLGQRHSVAFLRPGEWGFERTGFYLTDGATVLDYEDWYYCGFFIVRVKRPPPAAVLPNLRQGTGR